MDKKLQELKENLRETEENRKKVVLKIGKRANKIIGENVDLKAIEKELGVSKDTARLLVMNYIRECSR